MTQQDLEGLDVNRIGVVEQLEQTREIAKQKTFSLIASLSKVVLLTAVIFGAFFIPFIIGVETSKMKAEMNRMKVEIIEMDDKIQHLNPKISAYQEKVRNYEFGNEY